MRASPAYQALHGLLRDQARRSHVVAARNAKRVGGLDKTRLGTFGSATWSGRTHRGWPCGYLAGWQQTQAGMDHPTLLAPLEDQAFDYVAIGHARLGGSPLGFAARRLADKGFRRYVVADLTPTAWGDAELVPPCLRPRRHATSSGQQDKRYLPRH